MGLVHAVGEPPHVRFASKRLLKSLMEVSASTVSIACSMIQITWGPHTFAREIFFVGMKAKASCWVLL